MKNILLQFLLFQIPLALWGQHTILDQVKVGKILPDKAWVINMEQDTVYYKIFKDKWLIIDYWTRGCVPCIQEFPHLNNYSMQVDTSLVRIIGVYVGSDDSKVKSLTKKYNIRFPVYYGGWKQQNHFLALNFGLAQNENGVTKIITTTPQYVLIAPGGMIVDKNLPKPSDPEFQKKLDHYLAR